MTAQPVTIYTEFGIASHVLDAAFLTNHTGLRPSRLFIKGTNPRLAGHSLDRTLWAVNVEVSSVDTSDSVRAMLDLLKPKRDVIINYIKTIECETWFESTVYTTLDNRVLYELDAPSMREIIEYNATWSLDIIYPV